MPQERERLKKLESVELSKRVSVAFSSEQDPRGRWLDKKSLETSLKLQ